MELSSKYLKIVNDSKSRIKEISIERMNILINEGNDFVLIDTREESEWIEKHIPSAVYLGKGIIEREIEHLYPNEESKIILYCGGGYRSALAAENLQRMGYKNVYSLIGGIGEWEEKDFPIESWKNILVGFNSKKIFK